MSIRVSIESARGCGYRKPGGLYLVAGELSEPCPLLPLPLDRCPHCGQGIGPARGWTWITPHVLFPARSHGGIMHNSSCPLGAWFGTQPNDKPEHRTGERAGLIWVGEKFYPTPAEFSAEAALMGVSRRIKAVPHGFEIGTTWVYLGHRKAITVAVEERSEKLRIPGPRGGQGHVVMDDQSVYEQLPGVITLFKPTAIEYVVKGTETDKEIEALEKRGIQPVRVYRRADENVATSVEDQRATAPEGHELSEGEFA